MELDNITVIQQNVLTQYRIRLYHLLQYNLCSATLPRPSSFIGGECGNRSLLRTCVSEAELNFVKSVSWHLKTAKEHFYFKVHQQTNYFVNSHSWNCTFATSTSVRHLVVNKMKCNRNIFFIAYRLIEIWLAMHWSLTTLQVCLV